MKKNKKALVFIEYDMIIRHFVHSCAFDSLEKQYDVKYVFHEDDPERKKRGINIKLETLGLKDFIRFNVPRKRMGIWDHLYVPFVLHAQRGSKNHSDRLHLAYLMREKKWVERYRFLSLPGVFSIYSFIFKFLMGVYSPLADLVIKEKPDIVIHPTILQGYFINELVPICKSLKIPFVCLMNSWDNPSQKASATGFPDRLVVWGEQTRIHAVEFMKMPSEKVVKFGAAQFQIYRTPVTKTREKLCQEFGVPAELPILLYAGISKGVKENEQLVMLEKAISNKEIEPCHVIYRPHPWRGPLRKGEKSFYSFQFKHISIDPHMSDYYGRVVEGTVAGFDMADYNVTHRLLHLIDGVISPLSTILLEAIINEKPVQIMLNSETHDVESSQIMALASTIAHFEDLQGPGVNYCDNPSQIAIYANILLKQSGQREIKESLKTLASYFTILDGPSYSQRLLSLANEMTEEFQQ